MTTESLSREHRENAGYLERFVLTLRRSFFLSITVLGVFLVGLGYTFEMLAVMGRPIEDGIVAGMLGIWGATLVLVGGIGYATLRYMRNY
jgi:drug/metabolite transporter (DMT)-like permease